MSGISKNSGEVTRLLHSISRGSEEAFNKLLPMVYDELKKIARSHLRRFGEPKTFSTTDLVHETYLKMQAQKPVQWQAREHFYAVVSRAMRQIIVDYARRQQAEKRGNPKKRLTIKSHHLAYEINLVEILSLDQAMEKLDKANERLRKVVEYQFFGGMKQKEIADLLDISTRTVERDWVKAKLFLHSVMYPDSDRQVLQ